MSWGTSKGEENSTSGIIWKVLAGNGGGDLGGSGGVWVGSGGEGEEGRIINAGSEHIETVFSLWSLAVFVVGDEAGSEVGPKVKGMPLLGGKGGDGFDNSVPLCIAWDSSAGKKRATLC